MRLNGSITGGKRLNALSGLRKLSAMSCLGLLANKLNSYWLAMGSSPAPRSSLVILASLKGFVYLRAGESLTS